MWGFGFPVLLFAGFYGVSVCLGIFQVLGVCGLETRNPKGLGVKGLGVESLGFRVAEPPQSKTLYKPSKPYKPYKPYRP